MIGKNSGTNSQVVLRGAQGGALPRVSFARVTTEQLDVGNDETFPAPHPTRRPKRSLKVDVRSVRFQVALSALCLVAWSAGPGGSVVAAEVPIAPAPAIPPESPTPTGPPIVRLPGPQLVQLPAKGPLRLAVSCPDGPVLCSGVMLLRANARSSAVPGALLGRRTFTLRGGSGAPLALGVSKAAVTLARAKGKLDAQLLVTTTRGGLFQTATRRVRIEAVPLLPNPIRVTFVGDSVPAAINYSSAAAGRLARGFVMSLDLKVCRRLAGPSCFGGRAAPPSAVATIEGRQNHLGHVLVVMVGYNDGAAGYGAAIDRIMNDARRQGARGVVWVTLRERWSSYRATNAAIRAASQRWKRLVVADWNAYSAGASWFAGDGLHLNGRGADALAGFLRPHILHVAEFAPWQQDG